MNDIFSLKIAGAAGQGIKSAGLMLTKVATRSGYHTYSYTEYPSLIRGGHNMMQILFSKEEVLAPFKKTDFVVALNEDSINKHLNEIEPGGALLLEENNNIDPTKNGNINFFNIPLLKLAEEAGNKELFQNTVALGVTLALLGGDLLILKQLINEEFSDKGEKVVNLNQQAAERGYNYAREKFNKNIKSILTPLPEKSSRIIANGNNLLALGAIASGLQFAAIYPMTPITSLLHILAANQEKYGYIYKQPEDEISAINMAIGASFAGARSMTATSGGGFCLMTEGYGLAGMTETPLVIINGMRPGPATGLPTWSEQGDLQFVLKAHQGDFPKIILAAGDSKEVFDLIIKAFNLADKYQTPVVLLVDKNLCENDQSFPLFNNEGFEIERGKFSLAVSPDYKRFELSEDGISSRTIPGTGNFFIANSDEHGEEGQSDETSQNRLIQMKKRMKKLDTCEKEDMDKPKLFGPEEADLTLVSWGSNKGVILESLKQFPNVNFLYITWVNPFPTNTVREKLKKAKKVINIECNYSAQMGDLIAEKTGIKIEDNFLKYDGRPIFTEELVEKIKTTLEVK
ncbi:MAG: 2-oxoacid:acceptor oxidoreductase subunit alpha [Actinobacteria bacterium]|nr:2-oxoacid:acceptor oxidoreductase subunit alpha [Actinomycetota bacterium]